MDYNIGYESKIMNIKDNLKLAAKEARNNDKSSHFWSTCFESHPLTSRPHLLKVSSVFIDVFPRNTTAVFLVMQMCARILLGKICGFGSYLFYQLFVVQFK